MTEDYKGYRIRLEYDEDADNPLDEQTPEERGALFVLQHRRYTLPCELAVDFDGYESWTELAEDVSNGRPYKFVRWYEHSGTAVSLEDTEPGGEWDAGCAGVIIGESDEAIRQAFEPWAGYIEGEVYTLTVTAPDGTEIDTVGGLYGYDHAHGFARTLVDHDGLLTSIAQARCNGRRRGPRAQELHA